LIACEMGSHQQTDDNSNHHVFPAPLLSTTCGVAAIAAAKAV